MQSLIEVAPHVGVKMNPCNTLWSLWRLNSLKFGQRETESIANDIFVAEELTDGETKSV